jgi:hypothetical protein
MGVVVTCGNLNSAMCRLLTYMVHAVVEVGEQRLLLTPFRAPSRAQVSHKYVAGVTLRAGYGLWT